MIKALLKTIKNKILSYATDYIAIVDISNLITRIYVYKINNNAYDLLAIELAEIDFNNKDSAINGLLQLISKVESQCELSIDKVIINVPMHYVSIISNSASIIYNKNYVPSNMKKIFNTKKMLNKLPANLQFLFILFKKLQFDNYSLKSIKKNLFVKDINYVVDVVLADKNYFNTMVGIFNYLSIEVIEVIPADMILNSFFDVALNNPSCFIRLDYESAVVSKFENNKMVIYKQYDFGLNTIFSDLAKMMKLPEKIFNNFYEAGYLSKYDANNLADKFMLLNYQNVEYNINYEELKNCINSLMTAFLSKLLSEFNFDNVDKNSIYLLGELENMAIFSTMIENLTSNKALKNQLKVEGKAFEVNLTHMKAISMLKYHLYNKGSGLI